MKHSDSTLCQLVFTFLLTILTFQSLSQPSANSEERLMKYWKYRQRLIDHFILEIGPDWGCSLPISERVIFLNSPNSNYAKWGDSPVHLSKYIGVLSTEYELLYNEGYPTDQTLRELFYALFAINRLDLHGEILYNGLPALNGFFVRDDISNAHINTNYTINRINTGLPSWRQVHSFSSDWMASDPTDDEMSQDQVIWLLMACALVQKYIPNGIIYYENGIPVPFQDGNYDVRMEAMKIADRMLLWLKNTDLNGWKWIIKNPITGSSVRRGSDATGLSIGFNNAVLRINGILHPINHDFGRAEACRQVWRYLCFNQLPYGSDQDFKFELLNAIANSYPRGYVNNTSNMSNQINLEARCWDQYNRWIPYLHSVWRSGPIIDNRIKAPIDLFLDGVNCSNTWNYGGGDFGDYYSSSSSFLLHPRQIGIQSPGFPGDYNGLDYLFMHNLQYLTYRNHLPPFSEKNNVFISENLYVSKPPPYDFGSQNNPIVITSWGQIIANNTIKSNSDVTYRAGEEILLIDDFHTQASSEFLAYVSLFNCDQATNTIDRIKDVNLNQELLSKEDEKVDSDLDFYLFPNPSQSETLNILLKGNWNRCKVEVFTMDGRMKNTYTENVNGQTITLNTSSLTAGIYLIKIGDIKKKFIKL